MTGKINFYFLVKDNKDLRTFMIRIDDELIQNIQLDFNKLDYIDISKKIS